MARKQKDFLDQVAKQVQKKNQVKLMSGLVAGAIAGVAATWVLDRYQEGAISVTRRAETAADADGSFSRQQAEQVRSHHLLHKEAAQHLAQAVGKNLTAQQKQTAGFYIHYAVGAIVGGVYGLTAEWLPLVRSGYGTGFSGILFLSGPEPLLPWLNRGTSQRRVTPAMKVSGLSSHLIYGAVLETTRRVVRWML